MQQSSTTQSLHLCFWGLWKIVACSQSSLQCLLVFGMVSSLHSISFLRIFILVIYRPGIPQGQIPDSVTLSSLITRQSRRDTHRASELEFDLSEHSMQPQPHASAYSAFSLDNVGYFKIGMTTPHRVGGSAAKKEGRGSGYHPRIGRRMVRDSSDKSGQALLVTNCYLCIPTRIFIQSVY